MCESALCTNLVEYFREVLFDDAEAVTGDSDMMLVLTNIIHPNSRTACLLVQLKQQAQQQFKSNGKYG